MFDSPLINLVTALCGLAIGLLLVSSVLRPHWSAGRRWVVSSSLVVLVALGVALPGKLHAQLNALDSQHDSFSRTYEQQAHERCLHDMGRPDLVDALAFAREKMGDDARYYVRTTALSVACVVVNLMPSRPVRDVDFDPARDWIVLDGVSADQLAGPTAEQARRKDRVLRYSDSFTLVRPGTGAR